jgi:biopolymer transport protein TolR
VSLTGTNGHSRRRSDLPLNAEINVTSLVDVAFTLLVIFIIAAPVLQGGVAVSVPKAQVQPLTAEEHPFFVTLTRSGEVYLTQNSKPMTPEEFEKAFPQLARAGNFKTVYIRGDSLAYWGPMLKIIATLSQTTGVKFAMVGEPYGGQD